MIYSVTGPATGMGLTLVGLPAEIFEDINKNLDLGSLTNLARCSQFVRGVTTPHIWHTVRLTNLESLDAFTKTARDNSGLAHLVKSLFIDQAIRASTQDPAEASLAPPYNRTHLDEAGSAARSDEKLALLLPSLDKVEALQVCFGYYRSKIGTGVAFEAFGLLTNLLRFDYHGTNDEQGTRDHALPGIRRIAEMYQNIRQRYFAGRSASEINRLAEAGHINPLRSVASNSSSLLHLELRKIHFNLADLTHMVKACKSLRTLILEFDDELSADMAIRPSQVYELVSSTKNTLQNLSLEVVEVSPYNINGFHTYERFSSLSSLMCLKRIRLGVAFLLAGYVCEDPDDPLDDEQKAALQSQKWFTSFPRGILPPTVEAIHLEI